MRPAKGWLVAFAVVVGMHLAALYWPRVDLAGVPADSDKLAHAMLFAAPAFVGTVAWRSWWPAIVVAIHAPVSEYLQAAFLVGRSGTVGDTFADLAGVAVGILAAAALCRRADRRAVARGARS